MKRILLTAGFFACSIGFSFAQWIAQPVGFSNPIMVYEMEAVDQNVVWAAGADSVTNAGQGFVRSINGGQTWTSGGITNPGNFIVNNITAVDANTAWVAMVDDLNGSGMIKKTTNGGQTWNTMVTTAFSSPDSYPVVIHFFDPNNGVAFGDPVSGYWEIYTSNNGGTSWTRLPAAAVPTSVAGELGMFAKATIGDHIWVGSSEGRILHSANKGLTWSAALTQVFDIQAIAFSDTLNGLAMSNGGQLVRTADGGATWSQVPYLGELYDYDMAAVPDAPGNFVSTGFGFGNAMAGSSFSLDYGQTWRVLDSVPHMAVAFANANAGWTSGLNSRSAFKWAGGLLGVKKTVAETALKVHPNPSQKIFILQSASPITEITVTDLAGREVYRTVKHDLRKEIPLHLQKLPAGIYHLVVKTRQGMQRQKLVLE